jgi:tRNA pseudouridine32 synthase/23S rRNA pseudouridine746 synthase
MPVSGRPFFTAGLCPCGQPVKRRRALGRYGEPVTRWAEIRAGAVCYEDDAALVLNKPAGLAVMGERHETDLVRLAAEAGETLYPAHRIDKVTSGAVLLAKDLRLHGDLTRQFSKRTVDKVYLAITRSAGLPGRGTIELPLSVGRKNRVRIAASRDAITFDPARGYWSVPPEAQFQDVRSYPSVTTFLRVCGDEQHTLLAAHPVTGRRHQIRVHLAWTGHPIDGDPLFSKAADGPGRTLLHSWRLGFTAAWAGGARIRAEAPPGADFWAPLGGAPPDLPDWDTASVALAASPAALR